MWFFIEIFAYDFNLNAFDNLFNILASLGVMLNSIVNSTIYFTTTCFSFIISYLTPTVLIIVTFSILAHFVGGIRKIYKELCAALGLGGSLASLYALGQNGPNNKILEEMKRQQEEMEAIKAKRALENKEFEMRCRKQLMELLTEQHSVASSNTK